jgi:hypothetical protein
VVLLLAPNSSPFNEIVILNADFIMRYDTNVLQVLDGLAGAGMVGKKQHNRAAKHTWACRILQEMQLLQEATSSRLDTATSSMALTAAAVAAAAGFA